MLIFHDLILDSVFKQKLCNRLLKGLLNAAKYLSCVNLLIAYACMNSILIRRKYTHSTRHRTLENICTLGRLIRDV